MITIIERPVTISVYGEYNELQSLIDSLKFLHPKRFMIMSHQLWKRTKGLQGWDGYLKPMTRVLGHNGKRECTVPRGYKWKLLENIAKLGIKTSDETEFLVSPFKDMVPDDVDPKCVEGDFELDQFQKAGICAWLKNGMGINKAAVNSGKTMLSFGFYATLKKHFPEARMLYVTDRERLVTQVFKESKKFVPQYDVTKFGGGGDDPDGKDIVVCTSAMLRRHIKDLKASGWCSTFNVVLYDESHHASSPSAPEVLNAFDGAFWRIGCSDSVKADDAIASSQILGLLGPIVNEVSSESMISLGRSAVPHIYVVDVNEWTDKYKDIPNSPEPMSEAWVLLDGNPQMIKGVYKSPVYEKDENGDIVTKNFKRLEGTRVVTEQVPVITPGLHTIEIDSTDYEVQSTYCLLNRVNDRAIIRFKDRNACIVAWAKHFHEKNKRTLLVATRTMHVLLLESLISAELGYDCVRTLVGEDSSKERDRVFQWFRATPGAVLITPLAKEGVSINEIEAGIVCDYIASNELGNQVIGRFLRKKKEGDNLAEVVFFVDRQHPNYRKGSIAMLTELQKIKGYLFYHPCHMPGSEKSATVYDSTAEVEDQEDKDFNTKRIYSAV